ncbi:hypothetical protein BS78_01G233200 [Paspalum vaginatum]|nr:hypothetical protein BS78_01G233200 [Paspalum vaginatum]
MECAAEYLIAVGAAESPRWAKRWRVAINVIRTCHRLGRLTLSRAILRRTGSYVEIKIHDDDSADAASTSKSNHDDAAAPVGFSVAADDADFKGLVKEKRHECFRRLGAGAGIAAALASGAETGIRGDEADVRRRREAFGANTYPRRKPEAVLAPRVRGAQRRLPRRSARLCGRVPGLRHQGARPQGRLVRRRQHLPRRVPGRGRVRGQQPRPGQALRQARQRVRQRRGHRRPRRPAAGGVHLRRRRGRRGGAQDRRRRASRRRVPPGLRAAAGRVQHDGGAPPGARRRRREPLPRLRGQSHRRLRPHARHGRRHGHRLGRDDEQHSPGRRPSRRRSRNGWNASPPASERSASPVAVLVFAVLTARQFTGSTKDDQGNPAFDKQHVTFNTVFSALVSIFQQAVTIIVVAIPEGLPLAVTLTLAFSMKRMVKEHALVRTLSACETMGSVTAICTDKTGTLTLNQMKVTEFWVGTDRPKAVATVNDVVVSLLRQGAGLNTTGNVYRPDNVSPPEISGSPTEKALLSWAVAELGMDADALKRSCKVLHVEAFNSDKKRSGVMIRDNATGAVIAHWKGAAEMVLANCSEYVGADGKARELGVERRRKLEKVIGDMAAASLRCIAFACKNVDGENSKIDDEGLTLLGFVGLKDPCRPEVRTAIEACTSAGVAVKMVTGDNLLTARAIAKECGIISDNDRDGIVIEGQEFRAMSPEQQLEIVDRIRVMARSLPMDKLVLVQRLKQNGHVVAVTGDGTNDAPALKEADVGLSMGIQGTEVAKESSDIVIMNDNFDTVVTATRWGRCVFNNIQKFIQFQLTVNVAALIINFVSAVTSGKMPLTTGAAAVGEPDHGHHGRPGAGHGHANQGAHAPPAHRPHGAAHQQRHVAQPRRAGRVPGRHSAGAAVPRPRHLRPQREGQRHHDLQRLRALPGVQRVQRPGDRAEERLRRRAPEQDVPGHHRRHHRHAGDDGGAAHQVCRHPET